MMALVKIAFTTVFLALVAFDGIFLQHMVWVYEIHIVLRICMYIFFQGLVSHEFQEQQLLVNIMKKMNAIWFYQTVKEKQFVIMVFAVVSKTKQSWWRSVTQMLIVGIIVIHHAILSIVIWEVTYANAALVSKSDIVEFYFIFTNYCRKNYIKKMYLGVIL